MQVKVARILCHCSNARIRKRGGRRPYLIARVQFKSFLTSIFYDRTIRNSPGSGPKIRDIAKGTQGDTMICLIE